MKYEFTRTRKSARKRLVWGGLLVIILIVGGFYAWYQIGLRPANPQQSATVDFEIPSGQRTPDIAKRLKQAGLIRDKDIFITYVDLHGLRAQLQAGTYSLSPSKSTPEIADILSGGKVVKDLLVVPEGSTLVQIKKLAADHGILEADFKTALTDQYTSQYASQRPSSLDLEGYLFPDGYQVTSSVNAHKLIQLMLTDFDQKLTPDIVQAFTSERLTVHQGITLASMVEKEVANAADRPIVAQVFLSRIKAGQMLQSDVTVQYAANQAGVPFDLKLNSPYNTYMVKGLPIGPICNPGISAINAAAHPASTNYLYFVAGKDGKTHFARTLAEHEANVAQYLR